MILMASSPLFLTNESGNLLDNASKFNSDETNSDLDGDGFTNAVEEDCGSDPSDSTSIPEDSDSDGTCDILDDDIDGDSWSNDDELTCGSDPTKASSIPEDGDGDGFCDVMDAFPDDELEWVDSDNDGTGDNRDTDDDNDGVDDDLDVFPDYPCAAIDTDNDGFPDSLISWNCKTILQADWDDDNDGVFDSTDAYPLDACFAFDTDNDGLPNDVLPGGECDPSIGIDLDDDNDGWADIADAFPLNPREWADQDFDGIGNNEDINDDGDGWSDLFEELCETDSLSPASVPVDTDGDGLCDVLDPDDDNDGILDGDDSEPLSAAGSWQWATGTGDMVKINDIAMDSQGDIIVTGSYTGNTVLGDFTLEQHNKEDAFVAKMDQQGNWIWVKTTKSQLKLCANPKGPSYTVTVDYDVTTAYNETNMYGSPSMTGIFYTSPYEENSLFVNSANLDGSEDPSTHFFPGDFVYDAGTEPPSFIGIVSSIVVNQGSSDDEIIFEDNLSHYRDVWTVQEPGMELVKLNLAQASVSGSFSTEVNNGALKRELWDESFARANSLVIDDNDDIYITGIFVGFVKFDKNGLQFDDVIESYNVRNEGNWLRDRYKSDMIDTGQEIKWNVNSYPCGAPSEHFATGTDMFVAKIKSDGNWSWGEGAGSAHSDSGEVIALSQDGKHAYIAGDLRQNMCLSDWWPKVAQDAVAGFQGNGPGCTLSQPEERRNTGCSPINNVALDQMALFEWAGGGLQLDWPVESHKGMFNGIAGVPHLEGCGAYIAKIKLSNGAWKDAIEISPPNMKWEGFLNGAIFPQLAFPDDVCSTDLVVSQMYCSDEYVSISGLIAAGSPERLYITGTYGKTLDLGEDVDAIYSSASTDERAFMAKFIPSTGEWDWVVNGCGADFTKCDEIHDIVHNGIWHYFVSGCYDNQKFVAKYDFDGQEIWMQTFGSKCDNTELAINDAGDVYIAGTYSENSDSITIGNDILNHTQSQGHFVAHIDTNGNWVWAEDSIHKLLPNGHRINDDKPWESCAWPQNTVLCLGGVEASKPTGLIVDSNERVYVSGWINGFGVFKNNIIPGASSYVSAIDEPLQAPSEPVILVNPEDNSIPSISMLSSILVAVGAATIWKPKKKEDGNQITDQ